MFFPHCIWWSQFILHNKKLKPKTNARCPGAGLGTAPWWHLPWASGRMDLNLTVENESTFSGRVHPKTNRALSGLNERQKHNAFHIHCFLTLMKEQAQSQGWEVQNQRLWSTVQGLPFQRWAVGVKSNKRTSKTKIRGGTSRNPSWGLMAEERFEAELTVVGGWESRSQVQAHQAPCTEAGGPAAD